MRSELKIGIVVGVVIVVGIIIFVVKSTQDDNDQTKQMNMNRDKAPLQSQGNVQNPPIPTETTPTNPQGTGPQAPPVEVVIKEDNGLGTPTAPGKEVIPAVKEEAINPVIIVLEPEKKEPRYHVVKKGENLYNISEQYFGQGNQTAGTKAIQQANSELIINPDSIFPGWRLRIPYPEDIAP